MLLEDLLHDLPVRIVRGPQTPIRAVVDDSRRASEGCLFVARSGAGGDALRFVASAIERGAAAVLLPDLEPDALAELAVPESVAVALAQPGAAVDQRLVGQLAERFFDHPSAKLKLIGITGTNGKTTTATIVQHLLNVNHTRCGLIGTVTLDTGDPTGPTPATLTTPGAAELSALFAQMVANGCKAAVMEVSSHALDQGRVDALTFAAAGFTNLTQDHLDYHGNMSAYADAKAILFERLGKHDTAVLNADDIASTRMARDCKARIVFTRVTHADAEPRAVASGEASGNQAVATALQLLPDRSHARFAGPWGEFDATIPLVGPHNLSNVIQAAALAHAAIGLTAEQLADALETCPPVPGRLEPVGPNWPHPSTKKAVAERSEAADQDAPQPTNLPAVLVDYAHTPDALINVGKALRPLTRGRLITVFGCGGDRDRKKRPLMAQAAQQYADLVILTSDNPRTEDPQQILKDAAAGFANSKAAAERAPASEAADRPHQTIPDRAEAIQHAIRIAHPDDTILIAGKGHEDYQIIGTTKHHFDDRELAAAALRERLKP